MSAGILSELGTSRAAESQRTGLTARTVGGVPHDRILVSASVSPVRTTQSGDTGPLLRALTGEHNMSRTIANHRKWNNHFEK